MDEESSSELERARAGSVAAFELMLGRQLDAAHRLAWLMLGESGEAEDAVQEAALRAWTRLSQFRGPGAAFRTWFLRIVANECRMSKRRSWWSWLTLPDIVGGGRSVEEQGVDSADLREALLRLPERDRLALFLYYYLDLGIDDVAAVLGLSAGGAKTRIHRALRRMRPGLALEELRTR